LLDSPNVELATTLHSTTWPMDSPKEQFKEGICWLRLTELCSGFP
jgi:hypothetical protein